MKTTFIKILLGIGLLGCIVYGLYTTSFFMDTEALPEAILSHEGVLEGVVETLMLSTSTPIQVEGLIVKDVTGNIFTVMLPTSRELPCVSLPDFAQPELVQSGDMIEIFGHITKDVVRVSCEQQNHYVDIKRAIHAKEVGLSFVYQVVPEGYLFNTDNSQLSANSDYVTGYRLTPEEHSFDASQDNVPGEGPETIDIKIYRNSQNFSVEEWVNEYDRESYIERSIGSSTKLRVGDYPALHYKADGLYVIDVYVVVANNFVYLFTGPGHAAASRLTEDYGELLTSVTLSAPELPVVQENIPVKKFTGILEEVNAGCELYGECYVLVGGQYVTIRKEGDHEEQVGKIIGVDTLRDLEYHLGEQVEVYAVDLHNDTYTIFGSEGYYVKTISSGSATARLRESVVVRGITITPHTVEEDSRCPIDVVCVQSGTVRVTTMIDDVLGTRDQVFTLGNTITTEDYSVTLVRVDPTPHSDTSINNGEYTLTFKVSTLK